MFEIMPFKAHHLIPWVDQPANSFLTDWIQTGVPFRLENGPNNVTLAVNGKPMVCGGYSEYWKGRCELWAVFNEESRANFLPVFRGVKKWLSTIPCRRIELSIPLSFAQKDIACRRAELWGFELEAMRLRQYLPSGDDACLFSLVKERAGAHV